MRIALASDIHIDYAGNREACQRMAAELRAQQPDVLVLAGDVGSTPGMIEEGLALMRGVAPRQFFLPGNHDLWVRMAPHHPQSGTDSWDAYDRTLAQLAGAADFQYLPSAVQIIDGIGFVGETGWFDFSFRPVLPELQELPISAFEAAEFEGWSWPDLHFCDWGMDSRSVTEIMAKRLSTKLAKLNADDRVRAVVAVTHHVPAREQVNAWTPELEIPERVWDYCTVFMGATSLGQILLSCPKLVLALHGHAHFPGAWTIERAGFLPVRMARAPLGTESERSRVPTGRGLVLEI